MAFDTDEVKENQSPLVAEFIKLDLSANGQLTPVEASKDKLFTHNHFTKADADKDGELSENEYVTYKSAAQQKIVDRVVEDSVITAQAKAELLAEKDLKSLEISVETRKGQVILSGFVDNLLTRKKAEQIVSKIEGVKSVKNSLVIKS
jgi:hyperosmotically inducible protein